jgi:hypothetical protein
MVLVSHFEICVACVKLVMFVILRQPRNPGRLSIDAISPMSQGLM